MNLEIFDPAGRMAGVFSLSSVPPGGSLDVSIGVTGGYGHDCGGPAGTYIGVLQILPLVAGPQSTQALAGAETFGFMLPSPVHDTRQ